MPGFVRNVHFKNLQVDGKVGPYQVQLAGADAQHNVRKVTFENISILGVPLVRESPRVSIGPHVAEVQFGVAPAGQVTAQIADPKSPPSEHPKPHPHLGMNLSGPADWNTEMPFVDVFRFARPWISQRKGEGWGKGPSLALDGHGWVKRLDAGCWAETPLCTIEGGHYPSGQYSVFYDGQGKLDVSGGFGCRAGTGTGDDPSQRCPRGLLPQALGDRARGLRP